MSNEKKGTEKSPKAYLTKRILLSAARSGVRKAAEETMEIMGYTVIAQDGWIVRKYQNGDVERISQLDIEDINKNLALD